VQVAVVFFADPTVGLGAKNATLTIDNHNAPAPPAAFPFPLTANIEPGNVVDVAAVFDKSGSMADAIPGGQRKVDAAVEAGQLLVQLILPDLGNRVGVTRFSTTADSFEVMQEVTAGNQGAITGGINAATLAPGGNTAIAAGAMVGLKQFAVPRAGPVPATLSKAMIVLTDGKDNTAYLNPDDNKFYTVTGIQADNPTPPPATVATNAFAPPGDVKVFAVGLGTGQDIDLGQLAALSSGAGGRFLTADPASAHGRIPAHEVLHANLHGLGRLCDHHRPRLSDLPQPDTYHRVRPAARRHGRHGWSSTTLRVFGCHSSCRARRAK
jgi:von Willebrand factor type A domain